MQLSMKLILLINVKMSTIVGILTFISMINAVYDSFKAGKVFIFNILVFMKFHVQFSWAWKKFYNLWAWPLLEVSMLEIQRNTKRVKTSFLIILIWIVLCKSSKWEQQSFQSLKHMYTISDESNYRSKDVYNQCFWSASGSHLQP